jgi:hypothetical protein
LLALTLIMGVALALPAAHTQSLHAPHASQRADAPERSCSLNACGAFLLDRALPLLGFTSLLTLLLNLRPHTPLRITAVIDPPPRLALN